MGRTGTEVAKEASEIVITDDNFATIVGAVEEGRVVYANVKKALLLLLSTGLAEVAVLVIAVVVGLPLPFAAVQILWNNVVTEGTITVNLAMEPGEGDEMGRPPISRHEAMLSRPLVTRMLLMSAIAASTLLMVRWLRVPFRPDATSLLRSGFACSADPGQSALRMSLLRNHAFGALVSTSCSWRWSTVPSAGVPHRPPSPSSRHRRRRRLASGGGVPEGGLLARDRRRITGQSPRLLASVVFWQHATPPGADAPTRTLARSARAATT
jgi:magnesium-transporting ATPase (P-type)